MGHVLFCVTLFFFPLITKSSVQGLGPYIDVGSSWMYTYSAYNPLFQVNFELTSGQQAFEKLINQTSYDFAFLDSYSPPETEQIPPNYQIFPVVSNSIVPQFNLKALGNNPFILSREALVGIFMGNITTWNDPQILQTNLGVKSLLPNATIKVIFRSDSCTFNEHLTTVLSSFSKEWASTYGVSRSWPQALQKLPNMIAAQTVDYNHAEIILTPNSFGYSLYSQVVVDSSFQLACILNQYEEVVCPSIDSIAAASAALQLNPLGVTWSYGINDFHNAWFSAIYYNVMISTAISDSRCDQKRDLFTFFRWIMLDSSAKNQVVAAGFIPLTDSMSNYVVNMLTSVQCAGRSILYLESVDSRSFSHQIIIIINSIYLFFFVCLSIAHYYLFRAQGLINAVYTAIFLLGGVLTLSAPYAWNMVPDKRGVCLSRAWLTSMGLAILLGTIFCRTWQLRDIYNLQKKTIDKLQTNTNVRSSIIKLCGILFTIFTINFLLLLTWTVTDPYSPVFLAVDSDLHGRWKCNSNNMGRWMSLQVLLLSFLLFFGVYVIYRTWSFQRSSVIRETRWVLMVLYNIILNVVAAFPSAVAANYDDDSLSLIVMISLLFSGGGIVMAFLLPRVLRRIRLQRKNERTHSLSESGDKVNGHGHTPLSSPYPHHKSSSTMESPRSMKNHQRNQSVDESRERGGTESRNRGNGLSVSQSQSSLLQILPADKSHATSQPSTMIVIDENVDTQNEMIKLELPRIKSLRREEKKGTPPDRMSQEPSVNEEMDGNESEVSPTELNPSGKPASDTEIEASRSRLLLIPHDYTDRSVLPTPTDWSPNPLQGTEDATPLEDIGEL